MSERQARIPPQALEAERAVLGAALMDAAVPPKLGGLDPELFYKDSHQELLRAIQTLSAKGEPVDPLTVAAELRRVGKWDYVGGHTTLALLQDEGTVVTQVDPYVAIIREHATRRALIHLGRELLEAAWDPATGVTDTLDQHVTACVRLGLEGNPDAILAPAPFAQEVREGKEPPRQMTGWPQVDSLLNGGFTVGNLHILAGRPGTGKTAWALQFLSHVTYTLGVPALLVSLDMSRSAIGRRMLNHGTVTDLERSGFHIADPIAPTASGVVAMIRRAVVEIGIQVAVIDHAGKIRADRERDTNEQEVRETAVTLRNAARALNLPLLLLSQMSRGVEKRNSPKPVMSDLRASGALEEEAATVAFLWNKKAKREDYQDVVFSVDKDRDGPTGDVDMTFNRPAGRFPA